jgi:hypothetical protein
MNTALNTPYGKKWNRTIAEAKRLSISEDTLVDLFNQNLVPGMKIGPRIILFDPEQVDEALEKHFGKKDTERHTHE